MAEQDGEVRIAVKGYGVGGKSVADPVACRDDMKLVGIADIETDWLKRTARP